MKLNPALPWTLWLVILPLISAYEPPARWGQATVTMQKALFVQGGKVDQLNQFSYTSAPNVNDVLYLPLSKSFPVAAPPWELVNSASNNSETQGPALSWHTLSAFNTTHALLFGGLPGPNSQTVLPDAPDSAALVDLSTPTNPVWESQLSSWAGQPIRRIRHSAATAPSGNIYLFGGEKADGSQNVLAEYFTFNYSIPSFTAISAPPVNPIDVYGHATVVLDGRIVMLGGYSQTAGTLLPLFTLRVLDTKATPPTWSVVTTETTTVPSPRIGFATTVLPGKKILIHGGSDNNLQVNMEDGWVLDTLTDPMTWTQVEPLSQIGARRDHFAVAIGNQTIFGFGYGNNGPAPAAIQVFDFTTNSYVDTFTPPSSNFPTTTVPTTPSPTHISPPGSDPGAGDNGPPAGGDTKKPDTAKVKAVAAIVLGVIFGLVALVVVVGSVTYYRRRQNQEELVRRRQFFTLDGDEDYDYESQHLGGTIPRASMNDPTPGNSRFMSEHGLLNSLGIAGALSMASKLKRTKTNYERRDMLADEDTQSLNHWYLYTQRGGKDGAAGSTWSLKSVFGGNGKRKSRDNSGGASYDMKSIRGEASDPFADSAAVIAREEQTGFISGTANPGVTTGYRDPFADPIPEVDYESLSSKPSDDSHIPLYGNMGPTIRHISPVSSLPPLHTALPITGYMGMPHPSSTNGSQSSLAATPHTYTSRTSHSDNDLSRLNDSSVSHKTSNTSFDASQSPVLTGSAILGSTIPPHPIKRSDTWWARFSRTSILDRRSSDASRKNFDIRDPQPAPRLGAIEEQSLRDTGTPIQHTPQGSSPDSTMSTSDRNANKIGSMYPKAPKSMSSLRTANTEQIEHMAGTMDVVQRLKTRSGRHGSGSLGSTGGLSMESGSTGFENAVNEYGQTTVLFDSPLDEDGDGESVMTPTVSSHPPHLPPLSFAAMSRSTSMSMSVSPTSPIRAGGAASPPVAASGGVASRIQAFERKMSVDHGEEGNRVVGNKKRTTKVDYGLVPRASLFVANPDHRLSTSSS